MPAMTTQKFETGQRVRNNVGMTATVIGYDDRGYLDVLCGDGLRRCWIESNVSPISEARAPGRRPDGSASSVKAVVDRLEEVLDTWHITPLTPAGDGDAVGTVRMLRSDEQALRLLVSALRNPAPEWEHCALVCEQRAERHRLDGQHFAANEATKCAYAIRLSMRFLSREDSAV